MACHAASVATQRN